MNLAIRLHARAQTRIARRCCEITGAVDLRNLGTCLNTGINDARPNVVGILVQLVEEISSARADQRAQKEPHKKVEEDHLDARVVARFPLVEPHRVRPTGVRRRVQHDFFHVVRCVLQVALVHDRFDTLLLALLFCGSDLVALGEAHDEVGKGDELRFDALIRVPVLADTNAHVQDEGEDGADGGACLDEDGDDDDDVDEEEYQEHEGLDVLEDVFCLTGLRVVDHDAAHQVVVVNTVRVVVVDAEKNQEQERDGRVDDEIGDGLPVGAEGMDDVRIGVALEVGQDHHDRRHGVEEDDDLSAELNLTGLFLLRRQHALDEGVRIHIVLIKVEHFARRDVFLCDAIFEENIEVVGRCIQHDW